MSELKNYGAQSGGFAPVWTLEIQIRPDDANRLLDTVMAVHPHIYARHYEEPVIFLREDWASRATYDPKSDNPNRWWNGGRGLPNPIEIG